MHKIHRKKHYNVTDFTDLFSPFFSRNGEKQEWSNISIKNNNFFVVVFSFSNIQATRSCCIAKTARAKFYQQLKYIS